MDEFTFKLNSPLTEEDWDKLEDVNFDCTNNVWFHTKHGKDVEFVKVVRCRECKHSDTVPYGEDSEMPLKCLSIRYGGVYPDWFCEHGERKTDLSLGADNSNRCVCCGEPVPEGRMVCPTCERRANE